MLGAAFRAAKLCVVILSFLLTACGGGGGGGGASSSGSTTPGGSVAPEVPRITASVMTFPALQIPAPVRNRGASSLVFVAVVAPSSGSTVASAVVVVNGTTLEYSAGLKAYLGWFAWSAEDAVNLKVTTDAGVFSASGRQTSTVPQILSPRRSHPLNAQASPMLDLVRSEETLVTWEGSLPSEDHRFAVAVLDETGLPAWPKDSTFKVLPAGTPRQWTLPANAVPRGFPYVAAGIVKEFSVSGASAGSFLQIGMFEQSAVVAFDKVIPSPALLKSIDLNRAAPALAVQRSVQLDAVAAYPDTSTTLDATGLVSWSSDAPDVVSVSPTGLLTGLAVGTATITARLGSVRAQALATVYGQRTKTAAGEAIAYQIDPGHAGNVDLTGAPTLPQTSKWSRSFLGQLAYPLIAADKVFVLEYRYVPGQDGNGPYLHGLDAQTGAARWEMRPTTNAFQKTGYAYDQGRLFVQTANGLLQAIDAESGSVLWKLMLPELWIDAWSFRSAPTARDGVVYVLGAGVGNTLFAVDERTGKLIWLRTNIDSDSEGTVAVTADSVYVSGQNHDLRVDALTGTLQWRRSGPSTGGGGPTPAFFDGRLYVRGTDSLDNRILMAADGRSVAPPGKPQDALLGGANVTPISAFSPGLRFELDNVGLDGVALNNGGLNAIDLLTHGVRWRFAGDGHLSIAPVVVGQTAFVLSRSGLLYGVDIATGREVWRTQAGPAASVNDAWDPWSAKTGLAATSRLLAVPVGSKLSVYSLQPN